MLMVIEIGDEFGNGALEIDVVFPQRVVCVDEQGLVGGAAVDLLEVAHMPIIEGREDGIDACSSRRRCASMVVQTKQFVGHTIVGNQ